MRIVFLYRLNGENSTEIDTFIREATRRYPSFNPEKIDVDSPEAAHLAGIYDLTNFPSILVLKSDGQMIQMWHGLPLPTIDELISYSLEHA